MNAMLDYFQRVVTLKSGTYFSVHRIKPGIPGAPGTAHQDFASAEKDVRRWVQQGFNAYVAMGAQQTCEPDGTAIRKKENTVATRCLCMDIDVKAKGYGSTKEAVEAFIAFTKWAKLPRPTVVVQSGGGGFHVYWVFSELITPGEHYKLSDQLSLAAKEFGLKFDSNCTVDLVRLLRIPETLNFKHDPATPVIMQPSPGNEVDVDVMNGALGRWARVTPKSNVSAGSANDDLRVGTTYRRPTIDQAAELCPYIRETLTSGGSNLENEPQWHDMAALACHCVDPFTTIHRLCEKNQYYDRADTSKKLMQAQEYRGLNPALGPPKCVALQSNGAPHCVACLYLSHGTTPLALPFQINQINGHPYLNDLPPGYFRDDDYRICVEEKGATDDKSERAVVFPYPLYPDSGYLEVGSPGQSGRITFDTRISKETVRVSFETAMVAENSSFSKGFAGQLLPITSHLTKSRTFFMSYIQLLQSKRETVVKVPALGWEQQRDGEWGFAYAGEFVTPQGKFPCKNPPRNVAEYKVIGEDKIWRDMAQMVLTKDRPDLMVLAASAFSAPLVQMSGQNGYLIGAWSSASGIGKTTALLLAQSVWAYPALGGFSDTPNFTFAKCASIRDLPVIYDEIKGDQQVGNFVRIVFEMTSGREKGRSDRSGNMRETRTWHTNICYATNESIVSAVADQTRGTHASVYRIFEFEALNRPNANLTSKMAELTTQLGFNYGSIGKIYAEYLGQNHTKLRDKLLEFQTKLEQKLSARSAERCWIAAMSTTLFGAQLANTLGLAPFDVPLMREFMFREFDRMRTDRWLSDGDYTNPDSVYQELNTFMNESGRNTIVTDRTWTTQGKPPPDYARVISHQQIGQEIGVQISGDPLTIRIRESFFGKWCKDRNRHKSSLLTAIIKITGAHRNKSRLASGTRMATNSDYIIAIPVTGTPLEDQCEYAIQYKDLKP